MSYQFAKPTAILSPYIHQYWALDNCLHQNEEHLQSIVPTGLMELTFYLGDVPKLLSSSPQSLPVSSVSGQQNKPTDILVTGHLSMFSVTFKPQGAMMFFDLPLDKLLNQQVALQDIQKENTNYIEDQLYAANSFEQKVAVIESFLQKQFIKINKSFENNRISHSIEVINKHKGNISIEELASLACLSEKQYGRVFTDFVGISPKRFLRIIRFQNAIFQKQLDRKLNLTDVSYLAGYFDQSHMIADFKKLSGKTPKAFFTDCSDTYSDYFTV